MKSIFDIQFFQILLIIMTEITTKIFAYIFYVIFCTKSTNYIFSAAFEDPKFRGGLPENVLSTVIGLSRLHQFSSLCRAPPIAFKLGWNPEIKMESQVLELPSVPVHLLQVGLLNSQSLPSALNKVG